MKSFWQTGFGLIKRHGAAVLLFTAVYILMTWPLAKTPGTAVWGDYDGDGWDTVEQIWWYHHSLIEQGVSPFFDPHIFYPTGWQTLTNSHSPALMLPTVPLTMLLGPIGAYNVAMWLFGMLLAGMGAYLLIYRLTNDRMAGIIAGMIFAFCMARTLRFGGHLNVAVGSAWIPWIFVCVEEARRGAKSGRAYYLWFAAAGLCYAASVLSYFYYVYLVAIPLAAYLAYDIWGMRRERPLWLREVWATLLLFGVAAVLVAPLALLTLHARNATGVESYQLANTSNLVISPDRLFMPNRFHPLWGRWMRLNFPDVGEQSLIFLGITAALLAGMAVIGRLHPRTSSYTTLALVSVTMGLGPYLHWRDTLVTTTLFGGTPMPIPLPGLLFFNYAPFFDVMRVWARFGLITALAVAILAGFAVAWFRPKIRYGNSIALILLGLVILESWGLPFRPIPAADMNRQVDQWLAAQPEQFAIMELPLNYRLNGSLMYSRTLHNKPLALGYAVGMPRTFLSGVPHFLSFPNQETVDTLHEWGVQYLLYTVVDEATFAEQTAPIIGQLSGLELLDIMAGYPGESVYVYEIK